MSPDDLMRFSDADLIPGFPIPADVFIRLPSGELILVARKGSASNLKDLHVVERAHGDQFFIRKSDYASCVDQNVRIATVMLRRSEVSLNKKSDFLSLALDSLLRELQVMGFQSSSAERAVSLARGMVDMLRSQDELKQFLKFLKDQSQVNAKESLMVAAISTVMGRSIGWPIPSLEILALGGFLTNVGYSQLPESLLRKPIDKFDSIERSQWEKHPQIGAEILARQRCFPPEVATVVLEHHENSNGTGFPSAKREATLHQFSKVVMVASTFVDLVHSTPQRPEAMDAPSAIQFIERKLQVPFNASCWLALRRSLGQ